MKEKLTTTIEVDSEVIKRFSHEERITNLTMTSINDCVKQVLDEEIIMQVSDESPEGFSINVTVNVDVPNGVIGAKMTTAIKKTAKAIVDLNDYNQAKLDL